MVKEPVQPIKRNLAVDFFVNVQDPSDCLVVSRVQTEGPAVSSQVSDYRFHFRFHYRLHVRTYLQKVLEISSRKNQHFARTVHSVEVVPVARLCDRGPFLKVSEFFLGALRKQVGGESQREIAAAMEFLNNCIVLGIILEAATGVNDTGETKPI